MRRARSVGRLRCTRDTDGRATTLPRSGLVQGPLCDADAPNGCGRHSDRVITQVLRGEACAWAGRSQYLNRYCSFVKTARFVRSSADVGNNRSSIRAPCR